MLVQTTTILLPAIACLTVSTVPGNSVPSSSVNDDLSADSERLTWLQVSPSSKDTEAKASMW